MRERSKRPALKLRRLAWFVTNERVPQLPGAASSKRLLGGVFPAVLQKAVDCVVLDRVRPQTPDDPQRDGPRRETLGRLGTQRSIQLLTDRA